MEADIPEWICPSCKRPLDDHQLTDGRGGWSEKPLCVEAGTIKNGIRFPVK